MYFDCYAGRKILVTGSSGFKGTWLRLWLDKLGAETIGLALKPKTTPNHYDLLNKVADYNDNWVDLRNYAGIDKVISQRQPEIIFHLAAQPSVLESYKNPLDTISTNILGTANLLMASLSNNCVKAVVVVTTDKCYENSETGYAYKENDRLGGQDVYSASKACIELITDSMRKSFFQNPKRNLLVSTARAGNVIGGGDWTADRLVVDLAHSISQNIPFILRSPSSTRPWQHVLDPLNGYLLLGSKLIGGRSEFVGAWNFGPNLTSNVTTSSVVELIMSNWRTVEIQTSSNTNKPYEAQKLMIDSKKAHEFLAWKPILNLDETVKMTSEWYSAFYEHDKIITENQIDHFMDKIF